MNAKGILIGGLLAGLIINVGEMILNIPIIGAEFDAAARALGLPEMSAATIGIFVAMCFGLGILAVWLYAAIRPRFGPGPATALIAGIVVWVLVSAWPNVTSMAMEIFPARLLVTAMILQAVEIPLATLAGAWLYREHREPTREGAPPIGYEEALRQALKGRGS